MEDSQFLIDTSGHCLLCLEKVKNGSKPAENVESGETYPRIVSFQNLCSYLKTDLREVFGNSVTVQGLADSEMKGTLCGECAKHYEVFSKYYGELEENEEIQIKLETSLKLIYEKMMATVQDGGEVCKNFKKEMLRRPYTKFQYGIVERLRRKILEEFSLVFRQRSVPDEIPISNEMPSNSEKGHGNESSGIESKEGQKEVKLEREVDDDTSRHCSIGVSSNQDYRQDSLSGPPKPKHDASHVPTSGNLDIGQLEVNLEFVGNPKSGPDDLQLDISEARVKLKAFSDHHSITESGDDVMDESDNSCELIDFVENCGEVLVKTETLTDNVVIIEGNESSSTSKTTSNITAPIASSSRLSKTIGSSSLKEMWKLNPETGKHNCKDCSKEFTTFPTFYFHYRSEHLEIKYKCTQCHQGFSQVGNYNRHKKICLAAPTHVHFKCHICDQVFPLEITLTKHWQASCEMKRGRGSTKNYPPTLLIKRPVKTPARLGQRSTINPQTGKLKCSLCPKEFPHKWTFQHHYNSQHLNVSYHCTLCDQDFARFRNYRGHHETVHMKVRFKCQKCGKRYANKCHIKRHLQNNKCHDKKM